MDKVINLELLKNPFNWIIIFTVLVFVSYSAYVVWNASQRGLFNGASANAS